jgi:hypothetical protein
MDGSDLTGVTSDSSVRIRPHIQISRRNNVIPHDIKHDVG